MRFLCVGFSWRTFLFFRGLYKLKEEKNIWCVNLKDNRKEEYRNKDGQIKFRLCKEKRIVTIGWGVKEPVNLWEEYKEIADKVYKGDRGYAAARNALEKIKYGDLVWTKNPVTEEYYIAEITGKSDIPSIFNDLIEFDTCAYKRCRFFSVDNKYIIGPLCKTKVRAIRAIEKMGTEKRGDTIKATIERFNICKGAQNEREQ